MLYATGIGSWFDLPEGSISLTARRFSTLPMLLSIGGQPATLIYVGAAPYQPAMLQINAFVPEGLAPGDQPVVLKVGDVDNSGQGFTIPVR